MGNNEIVYLYSVFLMSNILYSIVAPILPLELKSLHINEQWNGVIFSAYALSGILSSLFIPNLFQGCDKVKTIMGGLVAMGLSFALFGFIIYLKDTWMIIASAIVLRLVQGASACLIKIMSYSMLLVVYPDEQVKYLGIVEGGMSLGMLIGPVIGSVAYKYTRFMLTFLIVGGVNLLIALLMYFWTKTEEKRERKWLEEDVEQRGLLDDEEEEVDGDKFGIQNKETLRLQGKNDKKWAS